VDWTDQVQADAQAQAQVLVLVQRGDEISCMW